MSKSAALQKRKLSYPLLIAILILAMIGITAWTVTSSATLGLSHAVTPTHARSFSYAEIVKPTYTPVPTQTPTSQPVPPPLEATEFPVSAEIVAETVAPLGYSSTTAEDALVAPAYSGNKRIVVDISEQHMYVYEGELLVYSFVSSTGMKNATRVGSFSVLEKIPSAYGATWDIWMPNWLGIYWAGNMQNGIHALPILPNGATLWAGYLGVPVSYGCIVLDTAEAQLLYEWADIGTPVEIQW
jgi:lipoprotein-anchoring transpeptidase ErfK/SrfK